MAPSPYDCPSPPRPACAQHDRAPMSRERNTGRRSDICAQRAAMIPRVPSQDLIRLRKLNDSRPLWSEITKVPPMDEVLRRRTLTEYRPEHKLNRASAARCRRTVSLSARLITVSSVGECNEESDPSDIVLLDIALADRFGA